VLVHVPNSRKVGGRKLKFAMVHEFSV